MRTSPFQIAALSFGARRFPSAFRNDGFVCANSAPGRLDLPAGGIPRTGLNIGAVRAEGACRNDRGTGWTFEDGSSSRSRCPDMVEKGKDMALTRRTFMKKGAAGLAGAGALPLVPFQVFAAVSEDGFIELVARETRKNLVSDQYPASTLWTYEGQNPGPEIRARRGERIRVRLINELSEATSIHWHGIRIDNAMDGVAGLTQDPVPPGERFEYDFVVPDAGTYWYHAHTRSWNQVARGLYGPMIIEGDSEDFDAEHDIMLVMDDWRLGPDGALDISSLGSAVDWSHEGRLGNWLTVNGKPPHEMVLNAGEAYRLRLLNASNARSLEIDPNAFNAKILAFDGQATSEVGALAYSPMILGSAQRVDLLVQPEPGGSFSLNELSNGQSYPMINFKVVGNRQPFAASIQLRPNDLPEPDLDNALTFKLHMTGGAMGRIGDTTYNGELLSGDDFATFKQFWSLNGVANLSEEPFFAVERNQSVIIEVFNDTAFLHAMHVHGHHFRIIERVGVSLDEGRPWKDTFLIGARQTTRIAFVADNPGKWLFHCHMLEHAAAGMTTWFNVS